MKQDVQIHVKLDTYAKLSELKAKLRKKSYDEVIKELIKVFESVVASASSATTATNTAGEASVAKATTVADSSYGLVDRSEGDGIIVEVYDGEPNIIDGESSNSGTVVGTETSTVNRSSGTVAGTGQYRKKQYKKRYKGDESWLMRYVPEAEEKE